MRAPFPLRAVTLGLQATSALVGTGLTMAAIPVREGARALSTGLPAPTLTRHSWRGRGRAWIEVRGLDGPDGAELGRFVVDAVRARPGVRSVSVNRPLSRIVVALTNDQISVRELCRDVDEAEKRWRTSYSVDTRRRDTRPKPLPGDGLLLATNALGVGATAVGVSAAVAGRVLRWPHLFDGVEAVVAAVDYQPRLRRLLEDRIGHSATDAVLSVATVLAHVLELSPASLSVDLAVEILKAAEYQAEAQAWNRHEPALARHAEQHEVHPPSRPVPPAGGPVERYAGRSALVQLIATAGVGAYSRNVATASTATLVTTPKATRTTRESFAAALGQGLAQRYAVLPLQPEKLRWLDRVDALLVDPRVLCTNTLRVVRVRGASEKELTSAWTRAQSLLERKGLGVGWQPVEGKVEALIGPTHDPLASAVLAEARRAGLELVSVDIEDLGELQPAFDELRPLQRTSIENTLAAALTDLQKAGHTVAVLSSAAAQALSSADVGMGLMPNSDSEPPPWTADLILSDLDGAWRLLHAIPAAKSASRARYRNRYRCNGVGCTTDGAGRPRARARPGDDGRGRRSAVGIPDGPRRAARTDSAAGTDQRVARDVDRTGPHDVAPTGSRAATTATAGLGQSGDRHGAARRRTDRPSAAGGLAIPQGGAGGTVRPADTGARARLRGQRDTGFACRCGTRRISAHRKLHAGGQPAAARREPTRRASLATDSTGQESDFRPRRGTGVHRDEGCAAAARRRDRGAHQRGGTRRRPTRRGRRPRGRRIHPHRRIPTGGKAARPHAGR